MNARGDAHGNVKLTMWDVIAIRCLLAECMPKARIARAFGVSNKTVRSIDQRVIWKWL